MTKNNASSECSGAGMHCIIPTLAIKGADKAIEQYKKAFGAVEMHKMLCPQTGVIAHCGLKIGDSQIFITEENPKMGAVAGQNQSFYLYVPNVDEAAKQAATAGLKEVQPVQDMFWGDRMGAFTDAFGIKWSLSTHVRDVTEKEMQDAMKKMASGKAA